MPQYVFMVLASPITGRTRKKEMLENRVLRGTSGPMSGSNMRLKKTIKLEN
jgi:hypothetical protein